MKKIVSLYSLVSLSALILSSIGFAKPITTETTTQTTTTTTTTETKTVKTTTNLPALSKISSSAIVQVHPSAFALPFGHQERSLKIDPTYFENELEAVVSPATLKLAAQALNIDLENNENALAHLKHQIRTSPMRGTDLIRITAHHPDKKEATKIANAIADAYIKNRSTVQLARAKKALATLDAELEQLSTIVAENRKKLTVLIQKHGIPYFDQNQKGKGLTKEEMIQATHKKLTSLKTLRNQIALQKKALSKKTDEELVRSAAGLEIPNNQVTVDYAKYHESLKQETDLKTGGFGKRHPAMVAAKKKTKLAYDKAHKEATALQDMLKTKQELIDRQIEHITKSLKELPKTNLPQLQNNYNKAKDSYEKSREILRQTKIKQQEARVLLNMPRPHITIHKRAE